MEQSEVRGMMCRAFLMTLTLAVLTCNSCNLRKEPKLPRLFGEPAKIPCPMQSSIMQTIQFSIFRSLALLLFCPLGLATNHARAAAPVYPAAQDPLDALTAAEEALIEHPDDPKLLIAAMDSALAAEEQDLAMWYAALALENSAGDKKNRKRDKRVSDLLAEFGGGAPLPQDFQADHTEALFNVAKSAESRKLYVNSVDLLGRCVGTPYEDRANERLEKIFSKDKAVEALLASGVNVPIAPRRRMRPSAIARFDSKHDDWEEPGEFKGKFYTVRTDMGYEYGTAFLEAMEQMNSFYRSVFNYKTRGQTMRRCVLHVYGSRGVFEQQEPSMQGRPTTRGFFVPGENRVAAYDRRTDGGTIDDLWSTLFHEASHQFTRAVWPGLIPTWLNEGTASYFEGAVLHPDGRVEKNLVPLQRLSSLVSLINRKALTLKEVVTYFRPGSYSGEYYPYGWGLVYFCHNYENEQAERPYLSIYREFMASYTGAAKHDVFDRFVEYFVTRAGIEGITTFEEFETNWNNWIQDLAKVTFGGAEQAEVLLAQGQRQLRFGKAEAASETARRALDKRSDHAQALALLAESLMQLKQVDGALLAWRQLEARATTIASEDAELGTKLREQALAGMRTANPKWTASIEAGEQELVSGALKAADAWVEAGSPRVALQVLSGAQKLLGKPSSLAERRIDIEAEHGVSIARWKALEFGAELDDWRPTSGWSIQDGVIVSGGGGLQTCLWDPRLRPPLS